MTWREDAACAETDPDAFFPEMGKSAEPAKSVCARCPVVAECLKAAVEGNEEFGVWGGLTTSERRPLRAEFVRGTRPRKVASHAAVARRLEAARLTREGLSAAEIGVRLGVATRTVVAMRAATRAEDAA